MISLPGRLVLASTSRYRFAQLERLGLEFEVCAPPIDEEALVADGPRDTVALRAAFKACAVQELPEFEEAWIIGADQGVVFREDDGSERLIGKPGDEDAAVAQLMELSGRSHELFTAVALALPGGRLVEANTSVHVVMRAFAEDEARAVVQRDQSWDCAGSYKIEAGGPWLMERVSCDDPTAIEGLPLMILGAMLRKAAGGLS
jgi:septum formation protein